MSGYLTLSEAAEYVKNKSGHAVEPAALLRAGVHGVLLIASPFSSLMRNLTAHKNDDVLGLLVIPPRHLLEIETDGRARITGATSLDGLTAFSPQVDRTRDQLRVLVSELDRLMPYWLDGTPTPQEAPVHPTPEKHNAAPKQLAQEVRILDLLADGGYVPTDLPSRKAGKSGVKALIKVKALAVPSMFTANSFDKAWQRLRDEGRLKGD